MCHKAVNQSINLILALALTESSDGVKTLFRDLDSDRDSEVPRPSQNRDSRVLRPSRDRDIIISGANPNNLMIYCIISNRSPRLLFIHMTFTKREAYIRGPAFNRGNRLLLVQVNILSVLPSTLTLRLICLMFLFISFQFDMYSVLVHCGLGPLETTLT